ncbi:Iron-sulfur cluster-binding protein [Olavius sp. associated proteobacterium Delta 1]|nr:Iron-sulfur cluster-binding protein [Olavius sp. associated proteobacterium Delta 1]
MEKITGRATDLAKCYGASAVGIVTTEMLAGGPPSVDLAYVLPNAKSAISFAVPLNQDYIESWFSKQSHADHLHNNIQTNVIASGISLELANYLNQKGYPSIPLTANTAYRTDSKNGRFDEIPPISHRYLAVRSGVGFFGLSGNVLTQNDGAAIILGSVVTEAQLIATDPIPGEINYCDDCRLCKAACASGFIDGHEKVTMTMGGMDFSYSKKRHHSRCDYVCGGFAGLHNSGKWSTWSPARFNIPDKDEAFYPALVNAVGPYLKRARTALNVYNVLMPGDRVELTCGNCQLICHPDKKIRKKRYKLLTESGVIVENPDGSREAVSPEEAKKHLAAMDPKTRALYEEV